MGDEHVAADDGIVADHGVPAQYGRAGIDGHVVLDGGVAALAVQLLAAPGGQRAQGDALVELHIVADDGGLADDDAGAVVDEEVSADLRPGVDVDAGAAVGVFRHDPGDKGHLQLVEHVGQAVDGDGVKAGIGDDHLRLVGGGGVTVVGGLEVRFHIGPDLGQLFQKGRGQVLGDGIDAPLKGPPAASQGDADLAVQVEGDVLDQRREVVLRVVDAISIVPVIPGEHQPEQLFDQSLDDQPVGLGEHLQTVDDPLVSVIREDAVGQGLDPFFKGFGLLAHGKSPPFIRMPGRGDRAFNGFVSYYVRMRYTYSLKLQTSPMSTLRAAQMRPSTSSRVASPVSSFR